MMLRRNAILSSIFCLGLAASPALPQFLEKLEAVDLSADAFVQGSQLEESGAWATRSQLVWNEDTDQLARKTFKLWQGPMEKGLTFRWVPHVVAEAASGLVSGKGTVIWQEIGSASYDDDAVRATYVGEMREGRQHGYGVYRHRSGFSYDGRWQAGEMHGTGYLTFTNGDHYVGAFVHGRLHGVGRLIDSDGTVFEGRFVNGVAQGDGLVKRADDLEYLAIWRDGTEVDGSRNVLKQPTVLNAQLSDAFRVGVVLENNAGQPSFTYERAGIQAEKYMARAQGETLTILPASQRILDVWRGAAPIALKRGEEADRSSGGGFLGIRKKNIKPVSLIFEFENGARSDVRIVSASVLVERSRSDLDPMLHVYSPINDCGTGSARPGFDPNFLFENFGWADVENGQLTVQFLDPNGRAVGQPDTLAVDSFGKSSFVNLVPIIARKGADVEAMSLGYQCQSPSGNSEAARLQAVDACIQKAARVAGTLAPTLQYGYDAIFTTVAGDLSYSWRDQSGAQNPKRARFEIAVPVGTHSIPMAECGEGGRPPDGAVRVFQLRLDQDNYRMRVPLKDVVPAGVTSRWRLAFEAERNSNHLFRLQFDLSDGRTVLSRPIELSYLHPRMPE